MYVKIVKRTIDVLISLVAIIILSPLFLLVALLIKITDPGPIFFKQIRIGKGGDEFFFYKFRSMPVNTGDIPSDEIDHVKISCIGKIIRRTSIDELPQLLNIIRGDMSIVGPRPPIASQDELLLLRKQSGAINSLPGLTGLAQINAFDGMSVQEKAEFDALYTRNISFFNDIIIILKTFAYVLKPPPKY